MLILDPPIGSFAPLNRALLLGEGVAEVIASPHEAAVLGARVTAMRREQRLVDMARRGWARYPVTGFQEAAATVCSCE